MTIQVTHRVKIPISVALYGKISLGTGFTVIRKGYPAVFYCILNRAAPDLRWTKKREGTPSTSGFGQNHVVTWTKSARGGWAKMAPRGAYFADSVTGVACTVFGFKVKVGAGAEGLTIPKIKQFLVNVTVGESPEEVVHRHQEKIMALLSAAAGPGELAYVGVSVQVCVRKHR